MVSYSSKREQLPGSLKSNFMTKNGTRDQIKSNSTEFRELGKKTNALTHSTARYKV